MFLFSCLPATVIWTSMTLRESFEIFFFMLSVFFLLKFRREGTSSFLLFGIFFGLAMGLIQHVLMFFNLLLIPLCLLWPKTSGFSWKNTLLAIIFLLSLTGIWKSVPYLGNGAPQIFFTQNLLETLNEFRHKQVTFDPDAKTTYGLLIDNSSGKNILISASQIFGFYLFGPFLWKVNSPELLYAFAEALFRTLVLLFFLIHIKRSRFAHEASPFLLLVIYLSLSFTWSLGTANFGTALRHHLTQNWILLLVLGCSMKEPLSTDAPVKQ